MPFTKKILPLIACLAVVLTASKDRHFVYLNFKDLRNVSRVSYVLTYYSRGVQKGFEGGFKTTPKTTRSTRRQILGTCSTRFCTYHASPTNFELTTTYFLRTGGTKTEATKL